VSLDPRIAQALRLPDLKRTAGTAVFVFPLGEIDAASFASYVRRHRALPGQVLLVRIVTGLDPHVPVERQASSEPVGDGLYLTTIKFGYDDDPDVPRALSSCVEPFLGTQAITYVVDEERLEPEALRALSTWQKWLFSLLLRRSQAASRYYRIHSGPAARHE